MSGQIRYSDEFKIDAVTQVTERRKTVERCMDSVKSTMT